jgi:hypothetical protein
MGPYVRVLHSKTRTAPPLIVLFLRCRFQAVKIGQRVYTDFRNERSIQLARAPSTYGDTDHIYRREPTRNRIFTGLHHVVNPPSEENVQLVGTQRLVGRARRNRTPPVTQCTLPRGMIERVSKSPVRFPLDASKSLHSSDCGAKNTESTGGPSMRTTTIFGQTYYV